MSMMNPRMNLLTCMKAHPTQMILSPLVTQSWLLTEGPGGLRRGGGSLGEMHPYAACGPNPAAIQKGQIAIILSHH